MAVSALLEPLLWLLIASAAIGVGGPVPPAWHIEDVPFAAQTSDRCGPAALAAVLGYWGEAVQTDELSREIHLPDYHGSLNLDLLIAARRRGFDAWAGEGTTEALKRSLSRGRPVICMVRRRNPLAARNHIVVLRGYDTMAGVWFLDSGEGAEERVANDDFDREWREAGRWMLVVEGRGFDYAQPRPTPSEVEGRRAAPEGRADAPP